MRISGFTTNKPNIAGTRTYGDFVKWVGERPARLGLVSNIYEEYTMTHLTESLMNIASYNLDKKKALKSIDAFAVEWDVATDKIERIRLVKDPVGTGINASEIRFFVDKDWYNEHDVFVEERSRQQFIVVDRPQRINDGCIMLVCKIQDDDYDSVVDTAFVKAGALTRFVSNVQPELHKRPVLWS